MLCKCVIIIIIIIIIKHYNFEVLLMVELVGKAKSNIEVMSRDLNTV